MDKGGDIGQGDARKRSGPGDGLLDLQVVREPSVQVPLSIRAGTDGVVTVSVDVNVEVNIGLSQVVDEHQAVLEVDVILEQNQGQYFERKRERQREREKVIPSAVP